MDAAIVERFWSKVEIGMNDECWPWRAGRSSSGYGAFAVTSRDLVGAHRIAYQIEHGEIPAGLWVLHHCDNPPCCNPAHLYAGTHADNVRDMVQRDRRPYGQRQHLAVLDEQRVSEIRSLYTMGRHTYRDLSQQFGVSQATIAQVIRRVTWRHVA